MRTTHLALALLGLTSIHDAQAEQLAANITIIADTSIECLAEAAHWYAFDFGHAPPGGSLIISLLFDPATQIVGKRTAPGDVLPIETVYCGEAGRAYETRFELPLRATALKAATAQGVTIRCGLDSGKIVCR